MSCRRIAPVGTLLMWFAMGLAASAQQAQAPRDQDLPPAEDARPAADQATPDQLPPEEDKPKNKQDYAFNPVRSNKEITVGEFYFKKSDFKAAAGRFKEATRWNDGNAEAWLRLGEAEARMSDT